MAMLGGLREAKAQSSKGTGVLPRFPKRLTDEQIDKLFARAKAELSAKTEAHIGMWHMDSARCLVDLEVGTITFTNRRRRTIRAPIQVIGTRWLGDGTFLWGWDHPSVPAPLRAHAQLLKSFGEVQGLNMLTTRKIVTSEDDAWEFTALATHLAAANGAYRAPTNKAAKTEVFLTFGEVTLT